jgi:hypothetical protein
MPSHTRKWSNNLPSQPPIVAVDFDDTISTSGVAYPEVGPPQNGAREALQALHDMGCRVRVYTCRCNGNSAKSGMLDIELKRVSDYMRAHGLYFDDVVMPEEGKPFASFYVDNKGISYQGDWSAVMGLIRGDLTQRVAHDQRTGQEVMIDRIAQRISSQQRETSL